VPKCILIADDHQNVRKLIRAFLETETGFEVCGEAVDGLDALQKVASLKPDLIVLDFQMPRMNGLDTARILRQTLPAVPIILFTLHKESIPVAEVSSLGINAVLSKTDGLDLLASHAARLLS
jgi:DNA-binding NarL/FixJ family response regulator